MRSYLVRHLLSAPLIIVLVTGHLSAQQPAIGLPPLGSFAGSSFDTVNLANLDVHFSIPIFSRPGRGIPFSYSLSYDSLIWVPVPWGGNTAAWQPVDNNWGWRGATEAATGWVEWTDDSNECSDTYEFYYHDPSGGIHPSRAYITSTNTRLGSAATPDALEILSTAMSVAGQSTTRATT